MELDKKSNEVRGDDGKKGSLAAVYNCDDMGQGG